MRRILTCFLLLAATAAYAGTEGYQVQIPPTQAEILEQIAVPNDGAVLTLQQGPTEPGSTIKLQIKDAAGNVVASIAADGTINIAAGAKYKVNGTNLASSDIGAEPAISAGTTSQYWRGDKSWQTLNKTAVGLGNVTNDAQLPRAGGSMTASPAWILGASGSPGGTLYVQGGAGSTDMSTGGNLILAPGWGGTSGSDGKVGVQKGHSSDTAYFNLINLTAPRTFSFPNNDGTFAMTGDYVKKAASSTDGKVPVWSGTGGDEIVDGYGVVTSISTPGSGSMLATESAISDAIAAVASGVSSFNGRTGFVNSVVGDYDDFYPTSAGVSGGQTLIGGTASTESLQLQGNTSDTSTVTVKHGGLGINTAPVTYVNSIVRTSGSGLNDASSGGTFTGTADAIFTIEIDATGTPDTFKWKKDSGSYTTGVSITGAAQTLSDGVTVTFTATTGHTLANAWTIGAKAQGIVVLSGMVIIK